MWDRLVRAVSDLSNYLSNFHLQMAILSELRRMMLLWEEDTQSDEDSQKVRVKVK